LLNENPWRVNRAGGGNSPALFKGWRYRVSLKKKFRRIEKKKKSNGSTYHIKAQQEWKEKNEDKVRDAFENIKKRIEHILRSKTIH
jgi:gas vesicle protein